MRNEITWATHMQSMQIPIILYTNSVGERAQQYIFLVPQRAVSVRCNHALPTVTERSHHGEWWMVMVMVTWQMYRWPCFIKEHPNKKNLPFDISQTFCFMCSGVGCIQCFLCGVTIYVFGPGPGLVMSLMCIMGCPHQFDTNGHIFSIYFFSSLGHFGLVVAAQHFRNNRNRYVSIASYVYSFEHRCYSFWFEAISSVAIKYEKKKKITRRRNFSIGPDDTFIPPNFT